MDRVIVTCVYSSACGELELASYGDCLVMCDWTVQPRHSRVRSRIAGALDAVMVVGKSDVLDKAVLQLDEYFAGMRTAFDIPLYLVGTELQLSVWRHLSDIPYGSLSSYGSVAAACGRPRAVRPVASCIGANPISIVVPCHRVIGKTGSLTGYAGGLPAKRYLLDLEMSILSD